MDCTICHTPVILTPSAKARAKKFGGSPSDYTRLFTEHTACALNKRTADTLQLIHSRRIVNDCADAEWQGGE